MQKTKLFSCKVGKVYISKEQLVKVRNENCVNSWGLGFIGSNLIKQLLSNKENKIICMDNNYTGSLENIKPFLHRQNLNLKLYYAQNN